MSFAVLERHIPGILVSFSLQPLPPCDEFGECHLPENSVKLREGFSTTVDIRVNDILKKICPHTEETQIEKISSTKRPLDYYANIVERIERKLFDYTNDDYEDLDINPSDDEISGDDAGQDNAMTTGDEGPKKKRRRKRSDKQFLEDLIDDSDLIASNRRKSGKKSVFFATERTVDPVLVSNVNKNVGENAGDKSDSENDENENAEVIDGKLKISNISYYNSLSKAVQSEVEKLRLKMVSLIESNKIKSLKTTKVISNLIDEDLKNLQQMVIAESCESSPRANNNSYETFIKGLMYMFNEQLNFSFNAKKLRNHLKHLEISTTSADVGNDIKEKMKLLKEMIQRNVSIDTKSLNSSNCDSTNDGPDDETSTPLAPTSQTLSGTGEDVIPYRVRWNIEMRSLLLSIEELALAQALDQTSESSAISSAGKTRVPDNEAFKPYLVEILSYFPPNCAKADIKNVKSQISLERTRLKKLKKDMAQASLAAAEISVVLPTQAPPTPSITSNVSPRASTQVEANKRTPSISVSVSTSTASAPPRTTSDTVSQAPVVSTVVPTVSQAPASSPVTNTPAMGSKFPVCPTFNPADFVEKNQA